MSCHGQRLRVPSLVVPPVPPVDPLESSSEDLAVGTESECEWDCEAKPPKCSAWCEIWWERFTFLRIQWLTSAPWTKNILAVWHTYLLCVAACAIACASLVIVLFWHVAWYHHYDPSASSLDFTLHFLAAFVKSWLLMGITSELLRFCYLLSVDAWRVEIFEAYRRALCFASFAEIAAGRLYVCGWPAPIQGWRKVLDLILQFLIFASLDILPLIMLVVDVFTWKNNFGLSSATLAIACVHVVLFWAGWTIGELALKVAAFKAACRAKVLKVSHLGTATRVLPLPVPQEKEFDQRSPQPGWDLQNIFFMEEVPSTGRHGTRTRASMRSMTVSFVGPFHAEEVDMPSEESESEPAQSQRLFSSDSDPLPYSQASHRILVNESVVANAESLGSVGGDYPHDLCMPICVGVHHIADILPLMVSIGVALVGCTMKKAAIIILGSEAAILIIIIMCLGNPTVPTLACWPRWRTLTYLQEWGDSYCGLRYLDQLSARMPFAVVTFLLGLLAAYLDWWYSMSYCAGTLLLCFFLQITVLFQKPWAWAFGILESIALMMLCCAVLWTSPVLTPAEDILLVFSCRVLSHQRSSHTSDSPS